VVLPLLAGLLLSAYGTGYSATRVAQHDGGAWLAKGTSVAHVDAVGQVDADNGQRLAADGSRLRVAQTPTGEVYVTDADTSQTYKIDPTTAAARPVGGTGSDVEVVAGPRNVFVVDRAERTVGSIDRAAGQPRRPAAGFGRIDDVVVDGGGHAWVLDGGRQQIRRVTEDGRTAATFPTGGATDARLALAAGRPVLVDPEGGQVVPFAGDRPGRPIRLPVEVGDRVEVNAPSQGGALWVADESTGALVGVDLHTGRVRSGDLGVGRGADLGPAVEHDGRLYVPDYRRHRVLVPDASSLEPARDPVRVDGESDIFDVFANNDRLWINDPYARRGSVIEPDGDERELDKGPGSGVADDRRDDGGRQAPEPPRPDELSDGREPGSDPGPVRGRDSDPDRRPVSDPEPDDDHGPDRIEVPGLDGMSAERACDVLDRLGLTCRKIGVAAPGGERPGTVVDVVPAAGTRVRPGRVVEVRHVRDEADEADGSDQTGGSDGPPASSAEASQPAGTPPAPPAAPTTVAVPEVRGSGVVEACAAVQAAGLACSSVPAKAAARPFVIHTQTPAAGTQVAPGSAVAVNYDDTQPATLFRIKREGTNVWVIGADQAHIQELMASGRYIDQAALGQAYPCCTRGVGHLQSIWSFSNSDTPHDGDNRYYSANPNPPGPAWQRSGEVGQVLAQQVEGTVPLYRVVKRHDGTADFSYTTPTDLAYYQAHNFQIDEQIGWIWP